MYKRLVIFDVDSLAHLLTHYSEGVVPLDSKVINVMASQYLPRWITLIIDSKDWTGAPMETGDGYGNVQPLILRYEGKRIMVLDHLKDHINWSEPNAIEAPTRTD